MFNLSGSELVFIAILGLIVLGPEKLPAAMRRAGKVYREVRNITGNMQREAQKLMEEPMREVRKMVEEPTQEIRKAHTATKDIFAGKMPHLQPRPATQSATAGDNAAADAGTSTDASIVESTETDGSRDTAGE